MNRRIAKGARTRGFGSWSAPRKPETRHIQNEPEELDRPPERPETTRSGRVWPSSSRLSMAVGTFSQREKVEGFAPLPGDEGESISVPRRFRAVFGLFRITPEMCRKARANGRSQRDGAAAGAERGGAPGPEVSAWVVRIAPRSAVQAKATARGRSHHDHALRS